MPKMPRPDIPTAEESQVLDLLRCYVGILADKHRIAAKHLMTAQQLLPLLRHAPKSREDLVKTGVLGEDASRLIGDEIVAMIHGKRALAIQGTQIQVVQQNGQIGDPAP